MVVTMYQGTYLDLKWQRDLGITEYIVPKFSKEGSRIAIYSYYNKILALLNSVDGSFLAGN